MKIEDGLNLPGSRVEIPDCGRDDFAKFLSDTGRKTGVEVGVYRGAYSKTLCEAGLKVFGVDCFKDYQGYTRPAVKRPSLDDTMNRLKGCDFTPIVKYSMDALEDFEDGSLDFVYIDANHTLPYVVADIFGWESKIRPGGIVSGHDYALIYSTGRNLKNGCHVNLAVDASVKAMGIKKYYILGSRDPKEGEVRDKWRSWFWIKE